MNLHPQTASELELSNKSDFCSKMIIFEKCQFLSKAMKFTQRSTHLGFFGGLWDAFDLNFLDIWSMAFFLVQFLKTMFGNTHSHRSQNGSNEGNASFCSKMMIFAKFSIFKQGYEIYAK